MKKQKKDWQKIFEEWKTSDLNVREFCKSVGISDGSFYQQRKVFGIEHLKEKKKDISIPRIVEVPQDSIKPKQQNFEVTNQRIICPESVARPNIRIKTASGNVWEVFL